jgi:RimJ/RimL family protein N-acetyltransferase
MKDIIIRKAKKEDASGIGELTKAGLKRKNWIYTGTNKFDKKKMERLKKVFYSKPQTTIFHIAVDKKNQKVCGSANFSFRDYGRLRHRVDLGWGVHPDYQGRGIATKLLIESLDCAKKMGFKRAEAEMAIENEASWKIAKKLGFKIEGTKKKGMLTDDGRYIDTYIVGRLL